MYNFFKSFYLIIVKVEIKNMFIDLYIFFLVLPFIQS